jgi:hypothetical protein
MEELPVKKTETEDTKKNNAQHHNVETPVPPQVMDPSKSPYGEEKKPLTHSSKKKPAKTKRSVVK